MTLQFKLVSAIIAEMQYRGDIEGQDDRHTPAALLRSFNDSAQKFRTKITDMGFEWFLELSTPAPLLTTAAATGETYTELPWPLNVARVFGIHVLLQPNVWVTLKPIGIQGIRDFQYNANSIGFGGFGGAQGMPVAFALQQAPFGLVAVETAGKIIIAPRPTQARPYRLVYLPVMTPLIATDTFNCQESHAEWIIWDMIVKSAARDNDARETYKIAYEERRGIEDMFSKMAMRTNMAGPFEPRRADFSEMSGYGGIRELP